MTGSIEAAAAISCPRALRLSTNLATTSPTVSISTGTNHTASVRRIGVASVTDEGWMSIISRVERYTSGTSRNAMIAYTALIVARRWPDSTDIRIIRYTTKRSHSTRLNVNLGLHVHHRPHALRPQIIPVASTTEHSCTPTRAEADARSSQNPSRCDR